MSVRIEKTDLPGIGVRHDLITERGRRIGIIAFRDGHREISIFDLDDPDSCTVSIPVTDPEASALAELLGVSVILSKFQELSNEDTGLFTEHILLPADSEYAGKTLGATKARTRTGVSIVAVVRNGKVIASPRPDERLDQGDALIAVGTRNGLDALAELIASSTG